MTEWLMQPTFSYLKAETKSESLKSVFYNATLTCDISESNNSSLTQNVLLFYCQTSFQTSKETWKQIFAERLKIWALLAVFYGHSKFVWFSIRIKRETFTSDLLMNMFMMSDPALCQTVAGCFWVAEKLSKHSFLFSERFARMIAFIAWNEPGSIPNTPNFAHHSSVVRVMRIYSFERCVKSLDAESFLGKPAKLIFNHYNEKKWLNQIYLMGKNVKNGVCHLFLSF